MNIVVLGFQGDPSFLFEVEGPWRNFRDRLVESNMQPVNHTKEENFHVLIANNHSEKYIKIAESLSIPKSRRALIIWEPSVVDSKIYSNKVLNKYGLIYTPSINWAKKTKAFSFKWPQESFFGDSIWINWRLRKKRAVIIQGNKFSACKGELYSYRRKVIKKLEFLDLYGTDWNRGILFNLRWWLGSFFNHRLGEISFKSLKYIGNVQNNYFGAVENKSDILSKYKISIVIENALDYVSEKIFDSLRAGCITIYIGPELEDYGIPKEAAFQLNPNFKDLKQLVNEILSKSNDELLEIAIAQRACIKQIAREWEDFKVLNDLAKKLIVDLK